MSSKRKTRSWPQAVAREMSTMKFKKGRLMGRPCKNRPLKLRITTTGSGSLPIMPAAFTASNDLSVCATRRHRLALQVPAGEFKSSSGAADRVIRHTVDADIRRKTANDRWGDIMARAGPYRRGGGGYFGSYRKPMGVWGCFRIYRPSSVRRFRPRKI